MIEGVIFDKDGVLFNTEPYYARISIEALRIFGIDLSEEEYYSFWTRDGKSLMDFLKERGKEDYFDRVKEKRAKLAGNILGNVPLIPGAIETVKNLSQLYPLALVTSAYRDHTVLMLNKSEIREYFRYVIAAEDVKHKKPSPDGFLLAGKYLDINPKSLVVIEDAEKGVISAHKAGMKCIAIPTKYTANNDFSLADKIVTNIREVTSDLIREL